MCQRVSRAEVTVEGRRAGRIGAGLLVLVGVERSDEGADASALAAKVARLRIFGDEEGRFALSLLDVGGSALVISQFTLIANRRGQKGTRPDFSGAAPKEQAEPLYERFCHALREHAVPVETGVFGAYMAVELVNDGPVTIVLDT